MELRMAGDNGPKNEENNTYGGSSNQDLYGDSKYYNADMMYDDSPYVVSREAVKSVEYSNKSTSGLAANDISLMVIWGILFAALIALLVFFVIDPGNVTAISAIYLLNAALGVAILVDAILINAGGTKAVGLILCAIFFQVAYFFVRRSKVGSVVWPFVLYIVATFAIVFAGLS